MSWQLFTLIQIAVFALAAIAALVVHNRRLRRDNEQLLALCGQAHEELVNVTGKLAAAGDTPTPEALLAERLKALSADDPVTRVRRLVLENELDPSPGFAELLAEHLGADDDAAAQDFGRRWRSIREECQQLAMFLVADQPDCLPAIRQLFEVMEPLDQTYGIALPPLDGPATTQPDDDDPAASIDQAASIDPATPQPEHADDEPGDPAATKTSLNQAALDALLADAASSPATPSEDPADTQIAADAHNAGEAAAAPDAPPDDADASADAGVSDDPPARTGTG